MLTPPPGLPTPRVLLVEDDPKIAAFTLQGLRERGFEVCHCEDGQRGLTLALQGGWEAIVLDLTLPGRDGLSVLEQLRAAALATPVILLTARNELADRLRGLSSGADDYLAKPFFVEELAARIQALLRRLAGERSHVAQTGALRLDRLERRALCHDHSVGLTSREFALLSYLMQSAGQVLTRGQILEHVWGYDFDPDTNVVDVCIKRLRSKLNELAPEDGSRAHIEAVRGVGYRLRSPPSAHEAR